MKRNCLRCHFLAKENREFAGKTNTFSWSARDRERKQTRDGYTHKCWWGIWDAGIAPKTSEEIDNTLAVDRARTCFFVEAHEGMNFEAAKELQKRREEHSELKRSNLHTQLGLWIAALGLLANLIFSALNA